MIRSARTRRPRSAGFNLVEVTIALGIAGLVVGGIFAALSSVNSQSKIKKATEQVTVLVSQVRANYANRGTFGTTDVSATAAEFTTAIINANLAPGGWLNSAQTSIINPWGGTLTVQAASTTTMTLTFNSINTSQSDCLALANTVLNIGKTNGLTLIDAQAVNATTTFASVRNNICTNASSNNLSFTFQLRTT